MDNFNLKKYLKEGNLLKEMAAGGLEEKSAGKKLFAAFKKDGLKPNYIADVRKISSEGDAKDMVHIEPGEGSVEVSSSSNQDKIAQAIKSAGFSVSKKEDNVGNYKLSVFTVDVKDVKESLNENSPGYDTRKFGEALPTLESVKAAHEAKGEGYKDFVEDEEKEKLAKAGDLKEEADPIKAEMKMHLKQYRDGMIDGDDLANALEEIIYGSVTPPEYNTRYGR